MGIRDKQAGLLGWIILFPIFMVFLFFIFTVLNKAYWDYRVDQMCEVDGGETVYRKEFFNREEYIRNFGPPERGIEAHWESSRDHAKYSVLSRDEKTFIRRGFIEISRIEITVFRASDKEVLAKSISYHRGGGDFPTIIDHGSSYHCGGDLSIGSLLSRTVFLKEKANDN